MKTFTILNLLSVLSLTGVTGYDGDARGIRGCPQVFGEKCQCGLANYRNYFPDREVYMTNCTNTGFTEPSVLEHLPKETEVLIFNGNHIPTLPWNVFGIWKDYENLTVVDLSNNGIKEIPGKTFHKVSNVKRLILDHNDLYIVSSLSHPRVFSNFVNLKELHLTNAFTEQIVSQWYLLNLQDIFIGSGLTKLEKLHLEQNEIWKISNADIFCPLKSLMDLHLGDNQLTDLTINLECLPKLRYLDITYNKMTKLNKQATDKIDEIFGDPDKGRSINIKGNPFKCDCTMRNFYDWFTETKVKISNKKEVRCFNGFPKLNAGLRLTNVRHLECEYDINAIEEERYDSSDALIHSLSVVLALITIALIASLVFYNRERLFSAVKNYSPQYSTIQKEDDKIPVNV